MKFFTAITNIGYYEALKQDALEGSTEWTINKNAKIGDRVLLYVCAPVSSIVATATVCEAPYLNEDVNNEWFGSYFAEMNELAMLNTPIPRRHLLKEFPAWRYWTQPRNSVMVPAEFESGIQDLLTGNLEVTIGVRKTGSVTHHLYKKENGHEWCLPNKLIHWRYCWICGLIRRADKTSTPCKGPAKITLRENIDDQN